MKSIRTRFLLGGVFVQAVTEAGASVMRDNCDHELKGPECGIVMSGETPEVLISLTRWVRLRLRAALWRQWKTPRRRLEALLALGVRPRLARNTAGSGLGPWYLARAKALLGWAF